MKITVTFIISALAAFALALPAPRLAVRSSKEQEVGNSVSTKSIDAKCWTGCGGDPIAVNDQHWGSGLTFGQQGVTTFAQLQQTFQTFGSISVNTANVWSSQSFQVQQAADQFHQMVSNFYQVVQPFASGCNSVCNSASPFSFQNTLVSFFTQVQAVLVVIQRQNYGSFNTFQNDLITLASCIQVVVALARSMNVNIASIFGNLNVSVWAHLGIQLNQYATYDTQSLFGSINNTPVASYNKNPFGYDNNAPAGFINNAPFGSDNNAPLYMTHSGTNADLPGAYGQ